MNSYPANHKSKVAEVIDQIRLLQYGPVDLEDYYLLSEELSKVISLQKRTNEIACLGTVSSDLDTAWELAKAEQIIRANGFDLDIVRILDQMEMEEAKTLTTNILKEYGEPK